MDRFERAYGVREIGTPQIPVAIDVRMSETDWRNYAAEVEGLRQLREANPGVDPFSDEFIGLIADDLGLAED